VEIGRWQIDPASVGVRPRSVEPVGPRPNDTTVDDVLGEELVIDERVRPAGCLLAILAPDAELPPADGSFRSVGESHVVAVQGVSRDRHDFSDGANRTQGSRRVCLDLDAGDDSGSDREDQVRVHFDGRLFLRAVLDIIYDILAIVTSADVIRALKRDGWSEVRVKGSHHHFKHPTKPGIVTVPHPKKDIPRGTLASIERQAGIRLR
jgi:predicted RNA binding protein YcfA (HicA-like mRNA interferase family)